MNYLIYWTYGTDSFDGKEFVIEGATQSIRPYVSVNIAGLIPFHNDQRLSERKFYLALCVVWHYAWTTQSDYTIS